ncbi:MAG: prolyl oligopeptidase family serine peptidase [Chloroflexota bacterium]|nr:prolyl oligopeptidase family serine peptidase [Dehalococcoidia bacterium]MDW8254636.1 prolyl oligopeptidase family serine peptidase [Chloroflexota bacterium]
MIPTRTVPVVDRYYGVEVADPYRWLEETESEEVSAWVEAQNRETERWLAGPTRDALRDELRQTWNYPRWSVPWRDGGRTFFFKNDGLQNHAVLYVQDRPDAAPRVLLDPNLLSDDGTVAVVNVATSRDGTLLAYGLSRSGSDWQEIRVRRVDSGEDLPETIQWVRFSSIAWRPDGAGFFYSRYPEPGSVSPEDASHYNRVYWHAVGTPQAQDVLIYERPDDKELGFDPAVTDDGRYLVLHVWRGTDPKNRVAYQDLAAGGPVVPLLDEEDARYTVIDSVGRTFYVHTDRGAPRGRIVAIDLDRPEPAHWREIVAEAADVIEAAAIIADRLVVVYLHDAHHVVRLFSLEGAPAGEIPLPTIGSVGGVSGRREDRDAFLAFTSFLFPTTIFRYDFPSGELTPLFSAAIPFDPDQFETRQIVTTSKDGTRIPVFVTHRRGLPLDGSAPLLLSGYGGFNVSLTPAFSVSALTWLRHGGVYAVATLRGGGEYGEEWHQAGVRMRKQNVFDDFIAAAEGLIALGYTRPERLAIRGGSNGGLLVAACVVQRPDLFGAVVAQVPVADMLRYHRADIAREPHAGQFWTPEYGTPEESEEMFRALLAYSPYHNVRPGTRYPPILITTADHDDRVVPAHALKLAAALQAANAGDTPILLRVETKAGHGMGKPIWKTIEEEADVLAFLFRAVRMG